jgi:hypothetical protein
MKTPLMSRVNTHMGFELSNLILRMFCKCDILIVAVVTCGMGKLNDWTFMTEHAKFKI